MVIFVFELRGMDEKQLCDRELASMAMSLKRRLGDPNRPKPNPTRSSPQTPLIASQTFSMETPWRGARNAAKRGSRGRFSAGGRFYLVKSAIEHKSDYTHWVLGAPA